ncbi:MAG: glycerophosphodiester phosphodiesterase [Candidatus Lokiarchaeota archaeon]|nr:glycerophosphodiester phosphodiesterase [Candidatus Lokiarchaeota archaeon]
MIGHRGTRYQFDENTLEAFKIAINQGANYIEFDVRSSKDGKLVVIHDETINRTTNGFGKVKDILYSEISKAKTLMNKSRIPLLEEVLEAFHDKIYFMIELKEYGISEQILELISQKRLKNSCIISGRDLGELLRIKMKYPHIQTCYNITKAKNPDLKTFLTLNSVEINLIRPDLISLSSERISSEFINKCHENQILALAWNFIEYKNPKLIIKKLINMNIDGILFDNHNNIEEIAKLVNKR